LKNPGGKMSTSSDIWLCLHRSASFLRKYGGILRQGFMLKGRIPMGAPSGKGRPMRGFLRRAPLLTAGLALLMSGCQGADQSGEVYTVNGFGAAVVADEPRAAIAARDVLASGGNAADAMVALYFALAVTMPSEASLGGGGVCLVHNFERKKGESVNEVLEFLPRAAPDGKVALPGNVRGMAALAARHGQLQWAQLVSGAEALARGTATSRALARDVQVAGDRLRADPAMAILFTREAGNLLAENDNLQQVDLAATLAEIRAGGANAFYSGVLGRKIAEAAQALGAPLTIDALRGVQVNFYQPLEMPLGDETVYVAAPPASGGILTLQMLAALDRADPAKRGDWATFLAGTSLRLAADRSNWLSPDGSTAEKAADLFSEAHLHKVLSGGGKGQVVSSADLDPPGRLLLENPWATSAVAVDAHGQAVACQFTMNRLFGAGRIATGTGILLAPAPNDRGAGFSALSPVIMANSHNGEFYYASAASGGPAGAIAQAIVLDGVVRKKQSLEAAMQLPRVLHLGDSSIVFYEKDTPTEIPEALKAAGYQPREAVGLGKVNAVFCPKGAPSNPDTCQLRNDRRGNGLSVLLAED